MQRRVLIATTSAYRRASWEGLCVVAGAVPIDILLQRHRARYALKKGMDAQIGEAIIDRCLEDAASRVREEALSMWQTAWTSSHKGRTTYAYYSNQIDFPTWMMQPMLVDLSDISNMQYQEELAELQNDESVKTSFNIKGAMVWLCEEPEIKYPNSNKCARKLLRPFPSSFLAECGFSAVNDLLHQAQGCH
ncbi:hypothetical protein ANTPLA_LOCUS7707 [Anthophora plagiata]